MPAPRAVCPTCGRIIALYRSGRLYRHDPPVRGRELLSCPSSLKLVAPPAAQPLLFHVDPPELARRARPDAAAEELGLF